MANIFGSLGGKSKQVLLHTGSQTYNTAVAYHPVGGGAAESTVKIRTELRIPYASNYSQLSIEFDTDTTDVDPTIQDRDDDVDGNQIITIIGTGRITDVTNSTVLASGAILNLISNGEPTSGGATSRNSSGLLTET